MSSTRVLIVLLALSGCAAQAQGVACPATAAGRPLASVTVYDGPPEENASLVPDATQTIKGREMSTWSIAGIYRAGRIAYLGCDYGQSKVVVVPVKQAKTCTYTESGTAKTLSCK